MCEVLRATLELTWPDKNDISKKEHYEQAAATKGLSQAEQEKWWSKMEVPLVPEAGMQVWQWYWELDNARGHSGSGPLPISYREIKDWIELTEARPTPGDLAMIKRLDREYLAFSAKKSREK